MPRQPTSVSKVITSPEWGYWPDLIYQVYDVDNVPCQPGFRIADNLGRAWRLVETSEVCTAGNMLSNAVTEVACAATKFDAQAIGSSEIPIDITATANAFDNGLLILDAGTGAGYIYPIISNTVGTAGTTDSTVLIEGGLVAATSASDTAGMLRASPFWGVTVANAADPTVEIAVGRCMATTSSTDLYCWAQTWGVCLLTSGAATAAAGGSLGLSINTTGYCQVVVAGVATIGSSFQAMASAEQGLCTLTLYP